MVSDNPDIGLDELWLLPAAIRGWKVARLRTAGCGEVGFAGVTTRTTYGGSDVARCGRVRTHVPPHPGCRCGFYAWRHRASATSLLWGARPALVEVELTGRFDEYELGYVAAAQMVRRVEVLRVCADCLLERRVVPAVALVAHRGHRGPLLAMCAEHAEPAHLRFDLSEVSNLVEAPVCWLEVDPVLEFHLHRELRRQERPLRYPTGSVADVRPGDVGHVFQQQFACDGNGSLWLRSSAPLIQPLPDVDVPIRRREDGTVEALLEGLRIERPWSTAVGDGYDTLVKGLGTPIQLHDEQEVVC
ncbi:MAG: hypothetical protein M3O70_10055 [Actinomycetota bacterium]|nr:hypothetical protein [Actinomycetota bacterium]